MNYDLRFLLSLLEELTHLLLHATGNGDTTGTSVLEHAAEGIEGTEERDDILGDTVFIYSVLPAGIRSPVNRVRCRP